MISVSPMNVRRGTRKHHTQKQKTVFFKTVIYQSRITVVEARVQHRTFKVGNNFMWKRTWNPAGHSPPDLPIEADRRQEAGGQNSNVIFWRKNGSQLPGWGRTTQQ